MTDVAQLLVVLSLASLAGAGIWASYDIARRKLQGLQDKQAEAIDRKIHEVASQLVQLENHELRLVAVCNDLDRLRTAADDLREDNKAEFQAMKTAFDRFSTKQAISETMNLDSRGDLRRFG